MGTYLAPTVLMCRPAPTAPALPPLLTATTEAPLDGYAGTYLNTVVACLTTRSRRNQLCQADTTFVVGQVQRPCNGSAVATIPTWGLLSS